MTFIKHELDHNNYGCFINQFHNRTGFKYLKICSLV